MVRFDPLGRFLRRTSTLAHDEFEPGDDKIEGIITKKGGYPYVTH